MEYTPIAITVLIILSIHPFIYLFKKSGEMWGRYLQEHDPELNFAGVFLDDWI